MWSSVIDIQLALCVLSCSLGDVAPGTVDHGLTKEEVKNAKQMFEECDSDGDHKLSKKELGEALKLMKVKFKDDELQAILKAVDKYKNRRLGHKEFLQLVKETKEFRKLDKNKDGVITAEDLRTALGKIHADDFTGIPDCDFRTGNCRITFADFVRKRNGEGRKAVRVA